MGVLTAEQLGVNARFGSTQALVHFAELRSEQKMGRSKRIDSTARMLEMDDGTTVAFDTLLIATGSYPIKPPIPGIDSRGVHPCWTLDDARKIM